MRDGTTRRRLDGGDRELGASESPTELGRALAEAGATAQRVIEAAQRVAAEIRMAAAEEAEQLLADARAESARIGAEERDRIARVASELAEQAVRLRRFAERPGRPSARDDLGDEPAGEDFDAGLNGFDGDAGGWDDRPPLAATPATRESAVLRATHMLIEGRDPASIRVSLSDELGAGDADEVMDELLSARAQRA